MLGILRRRGLTKLTVHLIPEAADALHDAATRTGDSRTDTVNRALQLYAHVTDMAVGESLRIDPDQPASVLIARLK